MNKMENMNEPLWERIDSLMKARNLNQKEFAAEIGVKPVTITEWKKGKSHSYQKIDTMRRIADALGVSMEELTQKEHPSPKVEERMQKNPTAPKSESGRNDDPTDTVMAQIIETANRLQPIQREFLLAFLKTVVQNTPAETQQVQRSWTISQAAVATGSTVANANIHP